MGGSLGQLLFLVLPVLASVRSVTSCYQSPVCQKANDNTLQAGISQRNKSTVCSILPMYTQCLQDALTVCQMETSQDLIERSTSTGTNITQLQKDLDALKLKYHELCYHTTDDDANCARGINSGNLTAWLLCLAQLALLTCVCSFL